VAYDAPAAEDMDVNVTGTGAQDEQTRPDTTQSETPAQIPVPNSSSTLPHALIASRMSVERLDVHVANSHAEDDEMKNLIMSWYYAGYYTGLREGQQQGRQPGTS